MATAHQNRSAPEHGDSDTMLGVHTQQSFLMSTPLMMAMFPQSSPMQRPAKSYDSSLANEVTAPVQHIGSPDALYPLRYRTASSHSASPLIVPPLNFESWSTEPKAIKPPAIEEIMQLHKKSIETVHGEVASVKKWIARNEGVIERAEINIIRHLSKSNFYGWASVVGLLLGCGGIFGQRRLTSVLWLSMAAVGFGTTGYAAVKAVQAENSIIDARFEKCVGENLKATASVRLGQLQNELACRDFYPLDTQRKAFVKGDHFLDQSSLFETEFRLSTSQIQHLETMQTEIQKMEPLSSRVATSLAIEIAALTVYTSNMIEKAGLPLQETRNIIMGQNCPAITNLDTFFETWNHAKALAMVVNAVRHGVTRQTLTPDHLKQWHACLMAEQPLLDPGCYCDSMAYLATNPTQVLAMEAEIPALVKHVFNYLNTSTDHDIEVLVNVHMYLSIVHPFSDGNGRIIRLLCSFLALGVGFGGFAITKASREEYLGALREWENQPKKFGDLMVRELLELLPLYKATQLKVKNDKEKTKKERTLSWFSRACLYWSRN
jgi:Fic family protein